jgi:hypothetical protein
MFKKFLFKNFQHIKLNQLLLIINRSVVTANSVKQCNIKSYKSIVNEALSSNETFNPKYYENILGLLPKAKSGAVQLRIEIFLKAIKE